MDNNSSLVLTVTQLNTYVKSVIDGTGVLKCVYVAGEISNFTNHFRTGHYYMTIKDENSCVKAVMFRSANASLRFMPENGMKVIVRARASLYERDGQFQLYIDDMQPDGLGALNLAFEQMKEKLSKEGLFDDKYKKNVPDRCRRIGVVTSATGAVIQDIKNVVARRYPLAEIILCPVDVQGVNAAPTICAAIELFNIKNNVDVLIVGRGGGSLEDLWAFNEESVARSVFASRIPVISAVGHETDFTICDFVADLRAPTPSAAAELAVPDIKNDILFLDGVTGYVRNSLLKRIEKEFGELELIKNKLGLNSPAAVIDDRLNTVALLCAACENSIDAVLKSKESELSVLSGKLDALSPLRVISRGYAIVSGNDKVITAAKQIQKGDRVSLQFADGKKACEVI